MATTATPSSSTATTSIGTIAVIGGGITGAIIATELANHDLQVILLDQGQRGPGGRASHRSVDPSNHQILPDDDIPGDKYEFDHGCQFFRADAPQTQTLVQDWIQQGWVAPWKATWTCLGSAPEFFGLPSDEQSPVYIGVGGMHQLPRKLLASSKVVVHRGTRVSQVTPHSKDDNTTPCWDLWGTSGPAAFHDTDETEAQKSTTMLLATVDAVILTDVSASQDEWHRASAGLPSQFVQILSRLQKRPRVPFFSCMVALKEPLRPHLQLDALIGDSPLWCALCSNSKPGFPNAAAVECWTLISTPDFAVQQIQETSMRDRTTGAFRPQQDDYLNKIPGPLLLEAFRKVVTPLLPSEVSVEPLYLQAQRWGSGLPSPEPHHPPVTVDGFDYVDRIDTLVYPRPNTPSKDFIADDTRRLYYAGDFCSERNPGFEAALLSGMDLVQHLVCQLQRKEY